VVGSVWAIVASGLVLTYSTTGVLNLGYGAVSYALADCFFLLRTEQGWDGWEAAVFTVFVIAPALALLLWRTVFRKLEGKGIVANLVSTIGLAVALPAFMEFFFPHEQVFVAPGLFDNGTRILRFWSIALSINQIAAIAGAVIVALGLGAVISLTKAGLVMRATVNRPDVAQLMGVRTTWVSAASWIVSCQLAAIGGILLAPILQLDQVVFIDLTVAALSVALVAGLTSLPLAYVSGIALGILSGWLSQFSGSGSVLASSLRPGLSFVVIVLALLLRRSPLTVRTELTPAFPAPVKVRTGRRRTLGGIISVLALSLPLLLSDYWRGLLGLGVIYALIFLSFTITLGRAGILSLGQAAIAGLGAFAAGYAAVHWGLPLLLAIVVGVVFAALCAGLIALVGLKLGVIGFGLLTLGVATFCDDAIFQIQSFVPRQGYTFNSFSFFGLFEIGSETSIMYFAAASFAVGALVIAMLKVRVAGLCMEAMELNPDAAESSGIAVRRYRTAAFMLGAVFAAYGGALFGVYQLSIGAPDVITFTGLIWLAVLVTLGRRTATAALVAGLIYSLLPAVLSNFNLPLKYGSLPPMLFGLGGLSLAQDPRGLVALYRDLGGFVIKKFGTGMRRVA
jgi:branched-chain amino acid transport system permease protein